MFPRRSDELDFPAKYTDKERQSGEEGWRTFWLINNHLLGILEEIYQEGWVWLVRRDAKIKQKLTLKWRLLGFLGGEHIQESALTIFCRLLRISILFQWHEIPWMESLMLALIECMESAGTRSRWWLWLPGQKHWVCSSLCMEISPVERCSLWTFNWF